MITYHQFLATASQIVKAHQLPDGLVFYNFNIGGSSSSGSSKFSRQGTTTQAKEYSLANELSSLIEDNYKTSAVDSNASGIESGTLNTLIGQDTANVPGLSMLQSFMGMDPADFKGLSALLQMSQRNPYSGDYEAGIGELYDRQFATARANAQSGPMNVRGGTARQGFELGEIGAQQGMNKFREIRGQQDREAGVVQQAVQTMNAIEGMRRGTSVNAQQANMAGELGRKNSVGGAIGLLSDKRKTNAGSVSLASEMLGKPKQTTNDRLQGQGSQVGQASNWGAGLSCCFIFLQALNGQLPDYVRAGREKYNTQNRRNGYVWMARWLVPMMQRSGLVTSLVNSFMIKPFLIVGKWEFGGRGLGFAPLLGPVCWMWFYTWSILGVTYGRKG